MENEKCVLCLQTITNPICKDCYMAQLKAFLNHIGINKKKTKEVLKKVNNKMTYESLNDERCIKCKKRTTICSYCFFYHTGKILRKMNFNKDFMQVYEATFDYALNAAEQEINEGIDYYFNNSLNKSVHSQCYI